MQAVSSMHPTAPRLALLLALGLLLSACSPSRPATTTPPSQAPAGAGATGAGTAGADPNVVPAPEPRPSPLMLARTTLSNGTYLKVHYSSPQKRGRTIFGDLVPYGQLWRTGANEAPEITVTQPVSFSGKDLPAGTYTLLTIPGPQEWTVILNRELGLNGTTGYETDNDVLRVTAISELTNRTHEAFTITFEEAPNGTDLALIWDRTKLTIPIRAQ